MTYYARVSGTRRSRRAKEAVWQAPVRGLVRSASLLETIPGGAVVLENFVATPEGAEVRGGARLWATVGAEVVRLFVYRTGEMERLFAATAGAIFDVTEPASATVAPVPAVAEMLSGDWSDVMFATPGGEFLVICNGADAVRNFNGAVWSTPTLTFPEGTASSADMEMVWTHKRRLWFIEKNSLSAWYLAPNAIAGEMTEFPLRGVFRMGGRLVLGGTWSTDAGDGMDDFAVFVTSEGELAVYQGTDPDSAEAWSLVGVFRLGRPLDKQGFTRAGGDMILLTEDGIVSVGEALAKDRAALQAAAITAPIEGRWQELVAQRTRDLRFAVTLWHSRTLMLVSTPTLGRSEVTVLCANTRTGGWSELTGWDMRAVVVWQDRLMMGTSDGRVARCFDGGSDFGEPYTARYVGRFADMGTTATKIAMHARAIWRGAALLEPRVGCFQDYDVGTFPPASFGRPRNAAAGALPALWDDEPALWDDVPASWGNNLVVAGDSIWGEGVWGANLWGGGASARRTTLEWQAVAAQGFSLAPCVVVGVQQSATPQLELIGAVVRYEEGRAI